MRSRSIKALTLAAVLVASAGSAWAQQPSVGDIVAGLPADFSPWSMFLGAHIVVKAVMVGLCLASLVTWTIALAKGIEIGASRRKLAAAVTELTDRRTLMEAAASRHVGAAFGAIIDAARAEIAMSSGLDAADGVKERIASRLERLEAAAGRKMTRGPACSRPSARPRRSSACSARSGAS